MSEFNLSKREHGAYNCEEYWKEDVKEFIRRRIYDSTKLLSLFNQGKLTSIELREHRQKIKDEAGNKLLDGLEEIDGGKK